MNILFLGYWGANEGLSQATINPHLEILAGIKKVNRIIYVSIERSGDTSLNVPDHEKIIHQPFYSKFKKRLFSKFYDFIKIPEYLRILIRDNHVDLLMCRSSLAGSIGYIAHRLTKVPFTVESFEPHAEYMRELGIWSKSGISYQIQKFLEKKQKECARYIMPVSFEYAKKLIGEGISPNKVLVMPCAVNADLFEFSTEDRVKLRDELGISSKTIVGIYVGKFGDIYLDFEAFEVFKSAFDYFEDFYLIILSPHKYEFIHSRCTSVGIPFEKIYHKMVLHSEVPKFLSASDFAFSTIRPSENRKFCSPIKNGEYWANGLPVLISKGIGDDSKIIQREKRGAVFSLKKDSVIKSLNRIKELLPTLERKADLAIRYRSFSTVEQSYKQIIERKGKEILNKLS